MGKSRVTLIRVYTGAVHRSKDMPYGGGWNAGLWDMVVLPTQPEPSNLSGKPKAHMYQKHCVLIQRPWGRI